MSLSPSKNGRKKAKRLPSSFKRRVLPLYRTTITICIAGAAIACETRSKEKETQQSVQKAQQAKAAQPQPTQKLYLPSDKTKTVDLGITRQAAKVLVEPATQARQVCTSEMVSINGLYCIDRFEVSLVDAQTAQALSPYFPPLQKKIKTLFNKYYREHGQEKTDYGRSLAVPFPPDFSLRTSFQFEARTEANVTPAGYLSRHDASAACRNAGKRLCSTAEWQRACRGQTESKFPYGDSYEQGSCNVQRAHHPASLLHADASLHHLDPRLNRTRDEQGPLLRKTGRSLSCKSQWQEDAVFDMVGNLDEWVASESGTFLGGFYARSTREGCDAQISVHSPGYRDYSLGTRCCRAAQ